jgi:hypothetical protein
MGRNGNLRLSETQQRSFNIRPYGPAQIPTLLLTFEKLSIMLHKLAVTTVAEDVDLGRLPRGQGQCELIKLSARISNKLL